MVGGYIIVNTLGEITAFSGSSNSGGILISDDALFSSIVSEPYNYKWLNDSLLEQVTQDQFEMMQIVACRELNKPYDLKGIIGLGIGRNWEQPTDWWCSELVAYILKNIGMKLNGWKPTYTYTPSMCYDWAKRVLDKSVF